MKREVLLMPESGKTVLRNMLELCQHDYTEFDANFRDLNEAGRYEYRYLDYYWTQDDRFPYVLKINGNYAGFALVRINERAAYEMSEFFILRKYRNSGNGQYLALTVIKNHKGNWEIGTHEKNSAAHFWRKVIAKAATSDVIEKPGKNDEENFSCIDYTFSNETSGE